MAEGVYEHKVEVTHGTEGRMLTTDIKLRLDPPNPSKLSFTIADIQDHVEGIEGTKVELEEEKGKDQSDSVPKRAQVRGCYFTVIALSADTYLEQKVP